jgi:6-phosphogluconate dehydrogenase
MKKTNFGVIGLGKMGSNLALQAIEKGYTVYGYDRFPKKELEQQGLKLAIGEENLLQQLSSPKIVFIYIPAGVAVDEALDDLSGRMSKGDIIVDGGNSYWGDSIRRAKKLKEKGIYLIDCGTSGGVEGARHGACFMVGGAPEAMKYVEPILKDLCVPDGYVYTGDSGSGHFVKLVHNGIEFGMLQAIGEGMDLLTHYREELNMPEILKCWNNGSVIRSWLIELMAKIYREKNGFAQVPSYIEDTGEVNWLVNDALHMEVPVPVISLSVMQLFASRDSTHTWAKAIAMMRHGFGGHPFGEDEGIKHERKYGRVGDFPVQ